MAEICFQEILRTVTEEMNNVVIEEDTVSERDSSINESISSTEYLSMKLQQESNIAAMVFTLKESKVYDKKEKTTVMNKYKTEEPKLSHVDKLKKLLGKDKLVLN